MLLQPQSQLSSGSGGNASGGGAPSGAIHSGGAGATGKVFGDTLPPELLQLLREAAPATPPAALSLPTMEATGLTAAANNNAAAQAPAHAQAIAAAAALVGAKRTAAEAGSGDPWSCAAGEAPQAKRRETGA